MLRNRLYTIPVMAAATGLVMAAATGTSAWALGGSIGIATTLTSFTLNDAVVSGTSTLPDNATLKTTTAPGDIRLQNGTRLLLATRSDSKLSADSVSLNSGAMRVANFVEYPVHVQNIQIQADSADTQAVISRHGRTVEVASLDGSVRVTDGGVLMTRVAAGTKMSFQAAQDTSTTGAAPAKTAKSQTGANPADTGFTEGDKTALLWTIAAIAAAAIAIGSIAIAQGKSL